MMNESESSTIWSSDGDCGDCIASCTVIKQAGGGKLVLYPAPVREPFNAEKVAKFAPLLEAQPYIHGVTFSENPLGNDLRRWRDHYKNGLNLADMQCEAFGLPHYPRNEPWLWVEPHQVAECVIHRSSRYHNKKNCWSRIMRKYKNKVFVGMKEEHDAFTREFGHLPWYETKDWLELGRVISGCKIFCGGQSGPMWLALGLCKTKIYQEQWQGGPNCHWQRPGCFYGLEEPPLL